MLLKVSQNSQENTGLFLWILQIFLENFLNRTPPDNCFWRNELTLIAVRYFWLWTPWDKTSHIYKLKDIRKRFIVKLNTSDIRMTCEYIQVTYGCHTSTKEWHITYEYIRVACGWHTSDIQVVYGWHTSTYKHGESPWYKWHTSDIRMTYEYIRMTYEWYASAYEWHTNRVQMTYEWHKKF